MSNIEVDLAAKQKPSEIWDEIRKYIASVVELNITTTVTNDPTTTGDRSLVTKIDLIQADRTNLIDYSFLKDQAMIPLREFHKQQVELGEKDVQKKIDFLVNLATKLIEIIKNKNDAAEVEKKQPAGT